MLRGVIGTAVQTLNYLESKGFWVWHSSYQCELPMHAPLVASSWARTSRSTLPGSRRKPATMTMDERLEKLLTSYKMPEGYDASPGLGLVSMAIVGHSRPLFKEGVLL